MAARHYDVSSDPNQAIVKIEGWAGPPSWYEFEWPPVMAIYADGRVIRPDSGVSTIHTRLYESHVTPEEIQLILAAADDAGLLGADATYPAPGIEYYDGPWTDFAVSADGKVHRVGAYLLGMGPTNDKALDVARARLASFNHQMAALDVFLGRELTAAPYDPASFRVFTQRYLPEAHFATPELTLAWPLDVDPGTGGEPTRFPETRCFLLAGSDLERFKAAAQAADRGTVWTHGADSYLVKSRPLFPDETGCPSN
jgi:hypothetical protein